MSTPSHADKLSLSLPKPGSLTRRRFRRPKRPRIWAVIFAVAAVINFVALVGDIGSGDVGRIATDSVWVVYCVVMGRAYYRRRELGAEAWAWRLVGLPILVVMTFVWEH